MGFGQVPTVERSRVAPVLRAIIEFEQERMCFTGDQILYPTTSESKFVHAIYDGGDTLDCWLDVRDGERRWIGNSDWGSLSEMLEEYAYDL